MFCFSILWELPGPKCLVLLYFGGFRGRNALFYNSLGANEAEMLCFTMLWGLPGLECFVLQYGGRFRGRNALFYNTLGASGAEMLIFTREIGTATPGVKRSRTATPGEK